MGWLTEPLIGTITPLELITFFLLQVAAVITARIVNMLIRRYLDEPVGKRLSKSVGRASQYTIIFTAAVVGFSTILNLDLSAIILSLGVAGVAVAFASQQILQNAIAGILISIIRPIQLEDWIEVGPIPLTGVSRVKDMTLMNTVLREADGRIITVPNSQIINGKVINYTRAGLTAVNIPMWIGNVADLERITQIVREEADRHPRIMPKVSEEERNAVSRMFERHSIRNLFGNEHNLCTLQPQVNLAEIQGTRARVVIKLWVREPNLREEIVSSFLAAVSARLTQENIELRDP